MAEMTAPDPASRRVPVGRFSRYQDAKRAVDSLRVGRVPERRITTVGRDLRWSPPLTAERAARLGACLGMSAGALTLLLLWGLGALSAEFSWVTAALAGGGVGGAVGGLLGLAAWRASRDKGLLPESGHVEVKRYDVLVERDDLPTARELLGR